MDSPDPVDLPIVEPKLAACRHLRSAGMYLYSDGQARETHAEYDNTAFWCLKSFTNFGPDDEIVGRAECRDPARTCYEPI
jgi:hypothetical protein